MESILQGNYKDYRNCFPLVFLGQPVLNKQMAFSQNTHGLPILRDLKVLNISKLDWRSRHWRLPGHTFFVICVTQSQNIKTITMAGTAVTRIVPHFCTLFTGIGLRISVHPVVVREAMSIVPRELYSLLTFRLESLKTPIRKGFHYQFLRHFQTPSWTPIHGLSPSAYMKAATNSLW